MSVCMLLNFVQLSSGTFLVKTPLRVLLLLRQFSHYFIALLVEQCSLLSDLSSRNSIKEISVAHEGLACVLDAILHCIIVHTQQVWIQSAQALRALLAQGLLQSVPSLQVSVAMLYYSIVMVSIGSRSTGSPSLSTFSSGECSNAILQYCYGFNRLQLWLSAQGVLQSVLSPQVSVAMLYYIIVMVSIGSSTGS